MAVNDILDFVEGSEYRKQVARQLAKRVAADIDLEDLIDQGEGYTDDLLLALFAALTEEVLRQAAREARDHARVLGLSVLDGATVGAIVERTLEPVLEEALTTLTARVSELSRAVSRMLDAGVSEDIVRASLASETGSAALLAPVMSVLTSTAAGMVNAIEKAVLDESAAQTVLDAADNGDNEPLFAWQTREDDRVCEDLFENSCAPRHGQELTLDEWGAFGIPGSENTICSIYAKGAFSNCRCVLESATNVGRMPAPIKIAVAIERGRRRAEEEIPIAA